MTDRRFQPGASYAVLLLSDERQAVQIVDRSARAVTLADGRVCRVLAGVAPDGGDEEVLRLDERGAVAVGGVSPPSRRPRPQHQRMTR